MKLKAGFHKFKNKVSDHSPEILVITGVAGVIVGTVLACKATIKAKAVKEEKDAMLDMIDSCESDGKTIDENNEEVAYSAEDAKKDRRTIKVKAWLKYGKIFAPAVVVECLSISAILFGHNILHKRYISLGSAYKALDKAYSEYRNRVKEKYGEEAEKDIRYGYSAKDKKKEGSEEQQVTKESISTCNPYAKFFDSSSKYWTKNSENNLFFLMGQQKVWNTILQARQRVCLNEIYIALGLEPTAAGQTIGYVFNKDCQDYIDFGIEDFSSNATRRFVNGLESVVLLNFNATRDIRDSFDMEK